MPKVILDKFALKPGSRLRADVSAEGIVLRPDDENSSNEALVIEKEGMLVIAGTAPFDAVDVILAARQDRESSIQS